MKEFSLVAGEIMRAQTALELEEANALTERFGLTLKPSQIARIAQKRFDALKDSGRVEFGRGIVKDLVVAFCDSPYMLEADYEETVSALIDSFYYFRNGADGEVEDGELIDMMRAHFDGACQGSIDALNDATLPDLLKGSRRRRDDMD